MAAADPVANRSLERLIKVVEDLDERRKGAQTVVARLNVVLHDFIRNRDVTLSGAYLGDSKGNVRLRLKHGETVLVDLAFRESEVELWLPRRNRFFRGTRREVILHGNNDLMLLAVAGNAHDLFFPRAWTHRAVERRLRKIKGREVVTVLEGEGPACRRVRCLALSPAQPVFEQQDLLGIAGRLIGSVQYDDYRFPGPRAGAEGGLPYPGRVVLTSRTEHYSLEMLVDEMHINTPIPAARFSVQKPEGQKVLPLAASLSSTKSLWE